MEVVFDPILGKLRKKDTTTGGSGMDASIYDPGTVAQPVLFKPLFLYKEEAVALSGNAYLGQPYIIIDGGIESLPAGVGAVATYGIAVSPLLSPTSFDFDKKFCRIFLTDYNAWYNGTYDVNTNIYSVEMERELMITDFAGSQSVLAVKDDFIGITDTLNLAGGGANYTITSSSSIYQTGSINTRIKNHTYNNNNGDPCLAYCTVSSSNEISMSCYNTALGLSIDADGQIANFSLYIEIKIRLTNA